MGGTKCFRTRAGHQFLITILICCCCCGYKKDKTLGHVWNWRDEDPWQCEHGWTWCLQGRLLELGGNGRAELITNYLQGCPPSQQGGSHLSVGKMVMFLSDFLFPGSENQSQGCLLVYMGLVSLVTAPLCALCCCWDSAHAAPSSPCFWEPPFLQGELLPGWF